MLTTSDRVSLASQCRAHGVALDRWHLTPLARSYEGLAFARLVRRIMHDEGWTRHRAEIEAAARIGINRETILSRQKEWAAAACRAA